jgi:RNA polymerase sigma-70 factor (ECF subfamily)
MSATATDIDLRDSADFGRAFDEHRGLMLAAANSVLHDRAAAEDVVQDIFVQLWLSPASYDPRRGSLRSYLVMLARSRAVDRWRSRAVARGALERTAGEVATGAPLADDAAEIVIRRDGARAAVDAVAQLPRPQQEALLLAYAGGYSASEVAAATGIPLGTAKSRLRLGLTRAREALMPSVAG